MQLKVFKSSRLEELEEERKGVEKAVSELWTHENLPFRVWGWESAKEIPSGKHPDKVQSEGVRDSDLYVLILGSEYGDSEYRESPTHKEYKTARSNLEEDCILIYIKEVERREEKLEKWIEELKNRHTLKPFKNSDQLKDLVKTRLRDLWNKGKWKASIPTIQSILKKGETLEGDFFKKEPEWIDFEEGFAVEREETDDVINKLENDNIQLVLGEPASGKSVILKNIGFKLANENNDVYVVELKRHSRDAVKRYFDDISEIKDEKAVFIVDDAHLLPTECERLVRDFKNMNLKAKLIIGSRETQEIRGEHPKEVSEFEYLSKTYTHAEDVTEEMIKRFLEKKYGFSDERINTVSKNLEEYKKDLWHLSWALKAYKPEKDSVEEEEIYEKVKDSIRDISAGKGKPKIDAEDIFLPLSVFYRFEIPAERNFLEEQLEIEVDKINQLIELSEIVQTEEAGRNSMLSLNHSSIAELYFGAYQCYPALGRKVRRYFQKNSSDMEYMGYYLFCQYMISMPINSLDVVINLGSDWRDEKGGKRLLKKIIIDKEIEEGIKEGIKKEENIRKITSCMRHIARINKEAALNLVESVESRIEKEGDVWEIGFCVWGINKVNEEVGLELVNHIGNILPLKIEKAEDIGKIILCAYLITDLSKEAALKLAEPVASKIGREGNIEEIRRCVKTIADVYAFYPEPDKEVALKLVNYIDVDILASKIKKEEDIRKIGECVRTITDVSTEAGLKLTNRIDIKDLASKIEKEKDVKKIGLCIESIAKAGKEVALKLVDVVSSRIEKEKDTGKVGSCVSDIAQVSEEVALKLVDIVSLRIEKEKDTGMVKSCVWDIGGANEKVEQEIVNRLNPKLRKEFQKRGWFKWC